MEISPLPAAIELPRLNVTKVRQGLKPLGTSACVRPETYPSGRLRQRRTSHTPVTEGTASLPMLGRTCKVMISLVRGA